jgi:hypothetical protein
MTNRLRREVYHAIQLRLLLSTLVFAQDTTTNQPTPTTLETTTSFANNHKTGSAPFPSSSVVFLPSNSASAGNQTNNLNAPGLVNYYFVFLALIVVVAAVIVFLMIRRRQRLRLRRRYSQNYALTQDLGRPRPGGGWANWTPQRTTGQYWEGRWRGTDTGREEGFNEHGEAPPPYIPKGRPQDAHGGVSEPAVPLQTLSRDGARLRPPPDYSEYRSQHPDVASSSRENARQNS